MPLASEEIQKALDRLEEAQIIFTHFEYLDPSITRLLVFLEYWRRDNTSFVLLKAVKDDSPFDDAGNYIGLTPEDLS